MGKDENNKDIKYYHNFLKIRKNNNINKIGDTNNNGNLNNLNNIIGGANITNNFSSNNFQFNLYQINNSKNNINKENIRNKPNLSSLSKLKFCKMIKIKL